MVKRKQPKELKVNTVFAPVQDWDARLKRVMELLLRVPHDSQLKLEMDDGEQRARF